MRKPLSEEHRERIGATRLGVTFAEYHAKRAADLKYCFGCQTWKPRAAFPGRASSADGGLNNECRACVNPRALPPTRRAALRRASLMNDYPIVVLKPEDQPSPPDPQTASIELLGLLRGLVDELGHHRDLLTRWGDDPTGVLRRAQPRAIDLYEQAARALDAGETLSRAQRAAGTFSVAYSENRP